MGNSDPLWVSYRADSHLELGNHFISSGSYHLGSCLIARAIYYAQYDYKLELQRRLRHNAPAVVTSKLMYLDSIDIEDLLIMCDQIEREDSFIQHCVRRISVYSSDKFLPLENVSQSEGYMEQSNQGKFNLNTTPNEYYVLFTIPFDDCCIPVTGS